MMKKSFFNFDSEEYDIDSIDSDAKALACLPKYPEAFRNLYTILREHKGMTIMEAYCDVLERMPKPDGAE